MTTKIENVLIRYHFVVEGSNPNNEQEVDNLWVIHDYAYDAVAASLVGYSLSAVPIHEPFMLLANDQMMQDVDGLTSFSFIVEVTDKLLRETISQHEEELRNHVRYTYTQEFNKRNHVAKLQHADLITEVFVTKVQRIQVV